MKEQFERTGLLLGQEAVEKLQEKRVAVFGVGGVGGYVAEALVRYGKCDKSQPSADSHPQYHRSIQGKCNERPDFGY